MCTKLLLYASATRARVKSVAAFHETAKQIGDSLKALAELCESAVAAAHEGSVADVSAGSGVPCLPGVSAVAAVAAVPGLPGLPGLPVLSVLAAAVEEARRGKHLAASLAPRMSSHHDLTFEFAAMDNAILPCELFDVMELDETGEACEVGVGGDATYLPRGKHSFTMRMAPINCELNPALKLASQIEWTGHGHGYNYGYSCGHGHGHMTRFTLQPSDVTVTFSGDPSATWECALATASNITGDSNSGALVVTYIAASRAPAVTLAVHVLGTCVMSRTLVSLGFPIWCRVCIAL